MGPMGALDGQGEVCHAVYAQDMTIGFTTTEGVVGYNLAAQEWTGNGHLVDLVGTFDYRPHRQHPGATPRQPDMNDEQWVFMHTYWALRASGVDFQITASPMIEIPLPPDAVA